MTFLVDDAVLDIDGWDFLAAGWAEPLGLQRTPLAITVPAHRAGCFFAEYEVPPEVCPCNRSLADLDA